MRVLVNFLPLLPRGGGLQNAWNLWRAVAEHGGAHEWRALARPDLGLAGVADAPHMQLDETPAPSLTRRLHLENVVMPRLAREWRADVVFTPMGAGPLRGPTPRVMGWHDSTVAYPESVVHRRIDRRERLSEGLRARMAGAAARRASRVCVQTPTMARRLARRWNVPLARFHVVPNGPSAILAGEVPAPVRPEGGRDVLVVAEAKPAKNLEVVPLVAAALRRRGVRDVRLVVTVAPAGDPLTRPLDRALAEAGPGIPVVRIGRVAHKDLGRLYRRAGAVFLPSLLESFSATYVEAMHFGVPLVTSDLDFARDICGDAALYADPLDPEACADALATALGDAETRARLREAGFRRLRSFPTWRDRLGLYVAALEAAVAEAGLARRPQPVPSPPLGGRP